MKPGFTQKYGVFVILTTWVVFIITALGLVGVLPGHSAERPIPQPSTQVVQGTDRGEVGAMGNAGVVRDQRLKDALNARHPGRRQSADQGFCSKEVLPQTQTDSRSSGSGQFNRGSDSGGVGFLKHLVPLDGDESQGGKQLPGITVKTLGLRVSILDGNPLFLPGHEAVWREESVYPQFPNGAKKIVKDLNVTEILRLKEKRVGVAADGVSQIVLVFRADVPGIIQLGMPDGATEDGTLEVLNEGKTCEVGDEHVAAALYTAPEHFGKGSGMVDPSDRLGEVVEARQVTINTIFRSTESDLPGRLFKLIDVKIVRPPVVLVHGTFDFPENAWLSGVKIDGQPIDVSFAKRLMDKGFLPFLVDYRSTNGNSKNLNAVEGSTFKSNKYVVWDNYDGSWLTSVEHPYLGGIKRALDHFRKELKVAATQADVVGHSMGGLLARVNASLTYNPDYVRLDNFGDGDINRLITISTPHYGSELPEMLEFLAKKDIKHEKVPAKFFRSLVGGLANWFEGVGAGTGALMDQKPGSPALKAIGETTVPTHAFVTVTQENGIDDEQYDPRNTYFWRTMAIALMFYWNPDSLSEFLDSMDDQWAKQGQDSEIFETNKQAFLDLIEAESEYWVELRKQGEVQSWLYEGPVDEQLVPEVVLEAFRKMIFRFDKNDTTVRVDSQRAGLPLDSDFVTYVANEAEADIQESVLHGVAPQYYKIQLRVVDVLKSGPDRFAKSLPDAGEVLPGHEPNIRGINWRITGSHAKAWSGMDFLHADAFLKVAKDENVVIMARPVNPDSTPLLMKGEATKSMNVKGKSSNWGPQKGYLPFHQRYSKIWRNSSGSNRTAKVQEFDDLTKAMMQAKKPQYQNPENGKPLAITKQLAHRWGDDQYSVWVDLEEEDAEQSIFMCRLKSGGEPQGEGASSIPELAGDPAIQVQMAAEEGQVACECQNNWFDWRTGSGTKQGTFDINAPPTTSVEPKDCKKLRKLRVLADNTQPHQPYLTADYDILVMGFHCPNGQDLNDPKCAAKVERPSGVSEADKCTEQKTFVYAHWRQGTPPAPLPCFNLHRGLISEAQKDVLDQLNAGVKATGYKGGNVSHHGPENQFFKSPYVDYPITVFDPGNPEDPESQPQIISIPKGPDGFRDLHLKRYFERKIRQGYWLYPNEYGTANWKWISRRNDPEKWTGWKDEDDSSLTLGEDVEDIDPPPCVVKEMKRLVDLRHQEATDPQEECIQVRPRMADSGGSPPYDPDDAGDGGRGAALLPFSEKEHAQIEGAVLEEVWGLVKNELVNTKDIITQRIWGGIREHIETVTDLVRRQVLGEIKANLFDEIPVPDHLKEPIWKQIQENVLKGQPVNQDVKGKIQEVLIKEIKTLIWAKIEDGPIHSKFKETLANFKSADVDGVKGSVNEVAAHHLGKMLGVNVPYAELVRNPEGKVLGVLMRWVTGKDLGEVKERDVQRFKDLLIKPEVRKQYLRDRILSALMGDPDRKINNYVVTPDGQVFPIDHVEGNPFEELKAGFQKEMERRLRGAVSRELDRQFGITLVDMAKEWKLVGKKLNIKELRALINRYQPDEVSRSAALNGWIQRVGTLDKTFEEILQEEAASAMPG